MLKVHGALEENLDQGCFEPVLHGVRGVVLCIGGATSVAAGRISYTFGLKGACLSIDTACSSSLVGAHYAARDIAAGDCDRALAAGVNLTLSPGKTSAFAITGTLPSMHPLKNIIRHTFKGLKVPQFCLPPLQSLKSMQSHSCFALQSYWTGSEMAQLLRLACRPVLLPTDT